MDGVVTQGEVARHKMTRLVANNNRRSGAATKVESVPQGGG